MGDSIALVWCTAFNLLVFRQTQRNAPREVGLCARLLIFLTLLAKNVLFSPLVRMRSPVQIWVAAPVKPAVPQGIAGFCFFFQLRAGIKRRNKRRNIGFEINAGQGLSLSGFLFYWPCALSASLTICPARRMLSSLAWAYMRSVTAVSLWPRRSLTDTTSAPLVIARLAEV